VGSQELVNQYVKLIVAKRALADAVKENQAHINTMDPLLLSYFEKHGIEKVTQGGYTLSPKRDLRAMRCKDENDIPVSDAVCIEALKEAGLNEYFDQKISLANLTTYFRELDQEGDELPEALKGKFAVYERFIVATRKANS